MPKELKAAPEDLRLSATQTAGHAENVQAVHTASDARIGGAMTGWAGASQAAMAAKAAEWQAASTVLTSRLADHAQSLHASGNAYDTTETTNAESISQLGPQADQQAV
ncbi:MAG TPA: WXG100 family type VII secretion target [Pseudonocardiaceae bacterium]|nr:WXG100 family type VII secretion target [Pseudonocardiaceae bacterium]